MILSTNRGHVPVILPPNLNCDLAGFCRHILSNSKTLKKTVKTETYQMSRTTVDAADTITQIFLPGVCNQRLGIGNYNPISQAVLL
ncbi:hypothetical protein BDV27DRAFT_138312 [Aspergillus caelatus]|uniref:Uncharacterized protein n=1 Tax=Aspergillus caelatus TaxID=61420 RepID=A0A5N6ZK86_9EURO|nr:uncharacterized protein BDV27DRAFT_138312 [Aspergillus caelatus]KAE8358044.1 hypothetical protein BDV27DRAFT_138312 [Aspergillus caelatus]